MNYEKPKPSAGLTIAGLLGLIVAYLLRWIPSTGDTDIGLAVLLLMLVGVLLLMGLWRLFSAIDAAVLHRWRSVTQATTQEVGMMPAAGGGDPWGPAATRSVPTADPEPRS